MVFLCSAGSRRHFEYCHWKGRVTPTLSHNSLVACGLKQDRRVVGRKWQTDPPFHLHVEANGPFFPIVQEDHLFHVLNYSPVCFEAKEVVKLFRNMKGTFSTLMSDFSRLILLRKMLIEKEDKSGMAHSLEEVIC